MAALHAKALFCGVLSDGVIGVVAAEQEDGDGVRVELQRATSFDGQDHSAGMDTYCLSLHTGASVYGGVEKWELERGRLVLELSNVAMAALGLEEPLVVEFSSDKTESLEFWLPRVLKGKD